MAKSLITLSNLLVYGLCFGFFFYIQLLITSNYTFCTEFLIFFCVDVVLLCVYLLSMIVNLFSLGQFMILF